MITKLSGRIADFIRNNNDQAASKEVLMFSIGIVLNTLLVTVTVLGVGAITGRLGVAATILASYVILRFFSGGVHLPTSTLCNSISIIIFLTLVHLPIDYWNVGLILNAAAVLITAIYAPTEDMMHLSRVGPKYALHFKFISLAIACSNVLIQSPSISLAFFAQSITLLPPAYKAVSLLERR